jgi:hypothetical protein
MNIFELEARDIRNYLERHGYDSKQGPDHIIVKDPVYVLSSSAGKNKQRTQFKDVMVRNWPEAIAFVEERD